MAEVLFQKPEIQNLKKKGYFCIDMHIHSEFSPDSASKAADIVKTAEKLSIMVAVTDHNEIEGAVRACKLRKGRVIPGIEVNSSEGLDILFYFAKVQELKEFYKKIIKPNKKKNRFGDSKLPALMLLKESGKYECLTAIAHPYKASPRKMIRVSLRRKKSREIVEKADALEAINGKYLRISNKRTAKLAKKLGKAVVGGSDSHKTKSIGSVLTCIQSRKKSISSIFSQIRAGNVLVAGK